MEQAIYIACFFMCNFSMIRIISIKKRKVGMNNLYDICIIGAGPSGSYAAYLLAKQGYEVLLIDKDNFPRDKTCGGFLSNRAQKYIEFWKMDMPIQNTISSLKLYSQKMESIKWEAATSLGTTILRKDFDNFILNKAIEQGVKFYGGIKINKIIDESNKVQIYTSDNVFTCKMLIGADGVFSFTARHLALVPRFSLYKMGYTCSQIVNIEDDTGDKSTVELYCIPFLGGFGWCFPIKNGFNIGVGASAYAYKKLHRYFYEFIYRVLSNKNISIPSLSPRGAFIPAGGFTRRLCRGRTILIGDASGGVDPFSGEGLEHAFFSASLAVDSICAESMEYPERICYRYRKKYHREIMPERRISLLASIASWKKGELFFNLFKHNPHAMKAFEIIMTSCSPYNYFLQNGLRYIGGYAFDILNPLKKLNK